MGARLIPSRGAHAEPANLRADVLARVRDPIVMALAVVALVLGFVLACLL